MWKKGNILSRPVGKGFDGISEREEVKMEKQSEYELRRHAVALSKLVGTTITVLKEKWDGERARFRKFYVSKKITAVELEIEPVRAVTIRFSDGTSETFFSMGEFDSLIGEIGEFGSIFEYLADTTDFKFFK